MNRRKFLKSLAMTAAAAPAAKLIPAALQAVAPAPYTTFVMGKEAVVFTDLWKQRSAVRDANIKPVAYNVRFMAGVAPDRTQRIRVKK